MQMSDNRSYVNYINLHGRNIPLGGAQVHGTGQQAVELVEPGILCSRSSRSRHAWIDGGPGEIFDGSDAGFSFFGEAWASGAIFDPSKRNMTKTTQKIDPDRARGCLLGLAVGDAFGATLEFEHLPERGFSELLRGPHVEITGGGPFHLPPFATTDDTAMAACLAASLLERSSLDVNDVAARYADWAADAPDVGNQTRAVLARVRAGVAPAEAAEAVWRATTPPPAANGALMRTAPIGVAFAMRPLEELVRAATDEAMITHWDPRCQLASVAFDAAIAAALTSSAHVDPIDMRAAAFDTIPYTVIYALKRGVDPGAVSTAAEDIACDLKAATAKDPGLYSPELHLHKYEGFVRVAFRLAFWELFHAAGFEAALVDVVNRGGDADTNGAITGALLGACYGENAIPRRWAEPMLRAHTSKKRSNFTDLEKLLALADHCAKHGGF